MAREKQANFIRQEEVDNCNEKKCICNKSYRQLPTAMVMCDLCKVWYHIDCINVQQAYAEAATFYHCETCVFGNFLPFLRYITHSRRQIQPGNTVELQQLHTAWNRKTIREQRTIEELQLPPEINIQVGEQQILSKRGMENPYNASCFMNAVLQVVCGSLLYKFLPTHRSAIKTVRLLNTIHEELCEQTQFPMPFNTSMYELGEELSLNLPQRRQFDGLEFLERIVRKIDEEAKSVTFEDTFFARTAELLICRACGAMKGQLQRPPVFRTRVPEWPEPILLSSLLWDAAACQYSIEDKSPGCTCAIDLKSTPLTSRKDVATISNRKQGMYYNLIMLLEAPPVLVIETNRVVGAMREGNINRTPIIVEEMLELKIATPKTDGHSYTYHLAASINLYAETQYAGHNNATLFDASGRAVIFDDANVIHTTTEERLLDNVFVKTTYALIYIRNDCLLKGDRSTELPTNHPWDLVETEKEKVRRVWRGDVEGCKIDQRLLSFRDLRTAAGDNWINDGVIYPFIKQICCEIQHIKATTTTTNFMKKLQDDAASIENHAIMTNNRWLLDNDIIIVPTHHMTARGENYHWSVSGIFPHLKMIVHCDSLHVVRPEMYSILMSVIQQWKETFAVPFKPEEWAFISPTEICVQQNGFDCGAYTCLNAYSLLLQELWQPSSPKDMQNIRTWITHKALSATSSSVGNRKYKDRIPVETAHVRCDQIKRKITSAKSFPGETIFSCLARLLQQSLQQRTKQDVEESDKHQVRRTGIHDATETCNKERAMFQKAMFLACANKERALIVKIFGEARYLSFMTYIRQNLFSYRREPSGRLFDYGGIEQEKFPDSLNLARENLYCYIILPELLLRYLMTTQGCSYIDATKHLYGSGETETVFHVGILLEVC